MAKKDKLTPKQRMFVKEYLVDLNATQAAIRAGYSANRASEIGYQLLQKTTVQEAIQESMKKREKRIEVTQEMIIEQLAKIGFADIKKFVKVKGNQVFIEDFDKVDGTILSEVSETQNGIKIKLNDKMKALELLGRHFGMFNDKLNLNVNNGTQDPGTGVNSLRELKEKQARQQAKGEPGESAEPDRVSDQPGQDSESKPPPNPDLGNIKH